MLEVTLEYNGLRAENLALRGKTKTLEAEQAVQLENAEVSVVCCGILGLGFTHTVICMFWLKINIGNKPTLKKCVF
jgi:hypothetical protein